jgi:TonB family protein
MRRSGQQAMSTAATQAPVRGVTNTRRVPRFPLAVPADVTVIREGTRYSIPGRSVTLGERGLGLVLAGELHPGDSVHLEFHLPDFGGRLQLNAVVRYQALTQCGLEFQGLTREQQKLIEHWTRTRSVSNPNPAFPVTTAESSALLAASLGASPGSKSRSPQSRRTLRFVFAAMLLLSAFGWWRWDRGWHELEAQLPPTHTPLQQSAAYVGAEVMESRLIHKIEPIYPEAARQANVQGVVILEAVIGKDGTVVDLRAISGPDELTAAALDAVKWWRFQPYMLSGRAVQVKTRLAVEFREN